MKKLKSINVVIMFFLISLFAINSLAGVPLTNMEGVGGIAFNPLAYPANGESTLSDPNSSNIGKWIGKPQFGIWYVNLGESKPEADWVSAGITETFFERIEVSYSQQEVDIRTLGDVTKDNFGTKLLLVEENSWDQLWMPAISMGSVIKHTSDNPYKNSDGVHSSGYDIYLVASKLITQTPLPLLFSGGVMSTDSRGTGVFGYADERDVTGFWNLDVILHKNLALGVEFKQGAKYKHDGSIWEDENYWDLHLAWFVNSKLTLVAAYVDAGSENSSSKVGLGDGLVLSLQYAF